MSTCLEMKKGEIYACNVCGIELQVVKDCDGQGKSSCGMHGEEKDECTFTCCGEELKKKS